jgi:hypothetical protein
VLNHGSKLGCYHATRWAEMLNAGARNVSALLDAARCSCVACATVSNWDDEVYWFAGFLLLDDPGPLARAFY